MPDATPMIIKETSSGLYLFSIRDEMLQNREVECAGEIDGETANSIIRQLLHLQREDRPAEITFYINSPGGEVRSALAIYDVMCALSCPIRTVCLGSAAGMAALLLASGSQRDILPHGVVTLDDPPIPGGVPHVHSSAPGPARTREEVRALLAQRTGRSLEEIRERTAQSACFSAEEAVAFGLADRIIREI